MGPPLVYKEYENRGPKVSAVWGPSPIISIIKAVVIINTLLLHTQDFKIGTCTVHLNEDSTYTIHNTTVFI